MRQIITVFKTGVQDQTKVRVKFNATQRNVYSVPSVVVIHAN